MFFSQFVYMRVSTFDHEAGLGPGIRPDAEEGFLQADVSCASGSLVSVSSLVAL